jgi:hypothetical protein
MNKEKIMAGRNTGPATKGSRYFLQNLVNGNQCRLNRLIMSAGETLREFCSQDPEWLSPLKSQGYGEYRDRKFLQVLGLSALNSMFSQFWPRLGPRWDALATVRGPEGKTGVILMEAKSHLVELCTKSSSCKAVSPNIRGKIESSLREVKSELGAKDSSDWLGVYYQYANRLAHLHWLYVQMHIPTWLVFLYFTGDQERHGSSTPTEWMDTLSKVKMELGLPQHHSLSERIIEVFEPVRPISLDADEQRTAYIQSATEGAGE